MTRRTRKQRSQQRAQGQKQQNSSRPSNRKRRAETLIVRDNTGGRAVAVQAAPVAGVQLRTHQSMTARHDANVGDVLVLRGSMRSKTVSNPGTGTGFVTAVVDVSPVYLGGNSGAFMSILSAVFDRFRFTKLRATLYCTGGSGVSGEMAIGYLNDSATAGTDLFPSSSVGFLALASSANAVSGPASVPIVLDISRELDKDWRYCPRLQSEGIFSVATAAELRLEDQGSILLGTYGTIASTALFFALDIEYEVELAVPSLNPATSVFTAVKPRPRLSQREREVAYARRLMALAQESDEEKKYDDDDADWHADVGDGPAINPPAENPAATGVSPVVHTPLSVNQRVSLLRARVPHVSGGSTPTTYFSS